MRVLGERSRKDAWYLYALPKVLPLRVSLEKDIIL